MVFKKKNKASASQMGRTFIPPKDTDFRSTLDTSHIVTPPESPSARVNQKTVKSQIAGIKCDTEPEKPLFSAEEEERIFGKTPPVNNAFTENVDAEVPTLLEAVDSKTGETVQLEDVSLSSIPMSSGLNENPFDLD